MSFDAGHLALRTQRAFSVAGAQYIGQRAEKTLLDLLERPNTKSDGKLNGLQPLPHFDDLGRSKRGAADEGGDAGATTVSASPEICCSQCAQLSVSTWSRRRFGHLDTQFHAVIVKSKYRRLVGRLGHEFE